jgi:hypothetical protein
VTNLIVSYLTANTTRLCTEGEEAFVGTMSWAPGSPLVLFASEMVCRGAQSFLRLFCWPYCMPVYLLLGSVPELPFSHHLPVFCREVHFRMSFWYTDRQFQNGLPVVKNRAVIVHEFASNNHWNFRGYIFWIAFTFTERNGSFLAAEINSSTVELHLSGRWLSGSAWPFE